MSLHYSNSLRFFCFPPSSQKAKSENLLHFVLMRKFLKKITRKKVLSCILFLQLVFLSLYLTSWVRLAACICPCSPRERYSNRTRAVHCCVEKPIITVQGKGIVHVIDKSLSVMSGVFCILLLSPRRPCTWCCCMRTQRHHSPGQGVYLAIMHDLHVILGCDSLSYNTGLIYIVFLSGVMMLS